MALQFSWPSTRTDTIAVSVVLQSSSNSKLFKPKLDFYFTMTGPTDQQVISANNLLVRETIVSHLSQDARQKASQPASPVAASLRTIQKTSIEMMMGVTPESDGLRSVSQEIDNIQQNSKTTKIEAKDGFTDYSTEITRILMQARKLAHDDQEKRRQYIG